MTLAGALFLAVIAGALHYKRRVPRVVAWLTAFAFASGAAFITGVLGGFSSISIAGAGICALAAIGAGIFFWEEAVRNNGYHRVRTLVVAGVFGYAVMNITGSVGIHIHNAVETTGTRVNQAVVQSVQSK